MKKAILFTPVIHIKIGELIAHDWLAKPGFFKAGKK